MSVSKWFLITKYIKIQSIIATLKNEVYESYYGVFRLEVFIIAYLSKAKLFFTKMNNWTAQKCHFIEEY